MLVLSIVPEWLRAESFILALSSTLLKEDCSQTRNLALNAF